MTRRLLENQGHLVEMAGDGKNAVDKVKACHNIFDMIFMDVVMPGMNGFQATRQITRNASTSHIPVIIVTTKDQETDRLWGKRQGAKEFLTKPIDEKALTKAISAVMG